MGEERSRNSRELHSSTAFIISFGLDNKRVEEETDGKPKQLIPASFLLMSELMCFAKGLSTAGRLWKERRYWPLYFYLSGSSVYT